MSIGRPDLQEQPFAIAPRALSAPFRRGEALTAGRMNELRDQGNAIGGAPQPRQYVPAVGGPAGGKLVEIKIRGAVVNAVDAFAMDLVYGNADPIVQDLWAEVNCPFLLCSTMRVIEETCDIEPVPDSWVPVFMLPPNTPESFKDRLGNQIYDPILWADPEAPVFVAFSGVRGLTLLKGHGEVWIQPEQAPLDSDYC